MRILIQQLFNCGSGSPNKICNTLHHEELKKTKKISQKLKTLDLAQIYRYRVPNLKKLNYKFYQFHSIFSVFVLKMNAE